MPEVWSVQLSVEPCGKHFTENLTEKKNYENLPRKCQFAMMKFVLKSYCTVFQHALKSLEITGIVLS